ncbi:MAG: NUDIX hydrolase [Rhodobacter sp.]|nr:NUDIX hydrolase [Rhodobacter sp.]
MEFLGSKLAILSGGQVLTMLRDDIPGLPYRGEWDLPGGGREGDELPIDCALRETWEETALRIELRWVVWRRLYPNPRRADGLPIWMFVAEVPPDELGTPQLGDEGQALEWMRVSEFLGHSGAIAHLQAHLQDYLRERSLREGSAHA